jgi:putative methanogen marker protein 4
MEEVISIDTIEILAKEKKAKIGIGMNGNKKLIEKSISSAKKKGYGDVQIFEDAKELVSALIENVVDGIVTGNLANHTILKELKTAFHLDHSLRAMLLQTSKGKNFFLAPVGIDDAHTIKQRIEVLRYGCELFKKLGIRPKTGLISGCRKEDTGRDERIDRIFRINEKITKLTRTKRIWIRHYGIELEKAIDECNFIVAPSGITGNLIFRTLCFLGEGKTIGAPLLNFEKVYIDTSPAQKDYAISIALASALVKK